MSMPRQTLEATYVWLPVQQHASSTQATPTISPWAFSIPSPCHCKHILCRRTPAAAWSPSLFPLRPPETHVGGLAASLQLPHDPNHLGCVAGRNAAALRQDGLQLAVWQLLHMQLQEAAPAGREGRVEGWEGDTQAEGQEI